MDGPIHINEASLEDESIHGLTSNKERAPKLIQIAMEEKEEDHLKLNLIGENNTMLLNGNFCSRFVNFTFLIAGLVYLGFSISAWAE